jgi:hypothetical protein
MFMSLSAFAAFPEPPMPTGTCAGFLSNTNSEMLNNVSIAMDFDEKKAVATANIYIEDEETGNGNLIKWSFDQDDSNESFTIERDPDFPAAFLITLSIDDFPYDFEPSISTPLKGNAFVSAQETIQLISVNNNNTFLVTVSDLKGICQAH